VKEKVHVKHAIIKSNTMSIDVDAQKGFTPICPGELPVDGGDLIVDELNKNAEFATLRVGSKDMHPANAVWIADDENPVFTQVEGHGNNVDVRWPAHCISGTKGSELLDGLPAPEKYDYFIWKGMEFNLHPYGIFYHDLEQNLSTGLVEYLMANIEIDTFIIGGLTLDYCVYSSIIQLQEFLNTCEEYDCRIILNLNATVGASPDTESKAIEDLENRGIILIDSTDDLELIE
jgi:nicotinamidase/pyrazinamidase